MSGSLRALVLASAALLLLASAGGLVIAQSGARKAPNAPAAAPHAPKAAPEAAPQISLGSEQTLYLVRSTLLSLNDANRSGNYTVLRDLAAPGFQKQNSAADLSILFAELRRRRIDLFAVAIMAPQLTAAPALDENKMLRMAGLFPTQPMNIKFDLIFENVEGQWRLFGISVQTPESVSRAPGQTPASPSAMR